MKPEDLDELLKKSKPVSADTRAKLESGARGELRREIEGGDQPAATLDGGRCLS
jgi:hypothetical protein